MIRFLPGEPHGPFGYVGWAFFVRVGRRALVVHERRGHWVSFTEREGLQRWRYIGPVCWTFRVDGVR